jgi:AMIN domain
LSIWLLTALVCAGAQITVDIGQGRAPRTRVRSSPVEIRNIGVIPSAQGASLEVFSSRPVLPQITKIDSPPRLVVNIPNSAPTMTSTQIPVNRGGIIMIRVEGLPQNPPATRIVVDLQSDVTYGMVTSGTQFTVELHPVAGGQVVAQVNPNEVPPAAPYNSPMEAANTPPRPPATAVPQAPAVIQPTQAPGNAPEVLPVAGPAPTPDLGTSLSAGADTAVMHLARGGELRVCPGTTLSVTRTKRGQELMLGVSTGSFEVHYAMAQGSDTIVTPDFRMQLTGPGLFDFAFSADARGNTCVRSLPSNQGSVLVTEVMGDGTYLVRPNEGVEFREGRIAARGQSGASCGCPSTGVPVMRAESKPPEPPPATTTSVVEPPQQTAPPQGQPVMSVEAPLVFSGGPPAQQQAPEVANLAMQPEPERAPLQATPPPNTPAPAAQGYKVSEAKLQNRPEEKKGFFAKMRGFFGGIFH